MLNRRFTGRALQRWKCPKSCAAKVMPMRDWIADWNKWSRAERVLALFVTFVLLALPLGILMSGKPGI